MAVTDSLIAFILMSVMICTIHGSSNITVNKTCRLNVNDQSRAEFTKAILRRHYNFMYMYLDFTNLSDTIEAKKFVIGKNHWIWTYKGEDGGHKYLFLPQDFGYLSFGLLWAYTNSSEYTISIENSGNCSGLTVGESESDQLIGEALGNMTSDIAARKDLYNSSYWCYNKRLIIKSDSLYRACSNSICTLQSIEFRCCKYIIDFVNRNRSIVCSKEHYHFDELWWAVPIIAGNICFALYPLFLSTIAAKLQTSSKKSKSRNPGGTANTIENEDCSREYVRVTQDYPVTLLATVFIPFLKIFKCRGLLFSRLLRIPIIVVPMFLPAVRIYLDATFARNLVKDAVKAGATVGFSSILADYKYASRFLDYLGGPYVAISMYFIFGIIFITLPNDLEDHIVKGLFEPKSSPYFILSIPLKQREKLGRINVRGCSGHKRFHRYLLLQMQMILNWRFWRHILRIFIYRWSTGFNFTKLRWIRSRILLAVLTLFIFPFYFVVSLAEVIFSIVYLAVPVVSCVFMLLNSYFIAANARFRNCSQTMHIIGKITMFLMFIAFWITWYMYCIIFFDGFWFLCRIIMFTYTGLVQFPRLSYGYIVLAFMAFYYIMDSLKNFGSGYRDLLKMSIEICKKVQSKGEDAFIKTLVQKNSIPAHLFNYIIEKHKPKRVQVCSTVMKVVTIISILCISIDLLITFDKFAELSVVTHVFTVLFICALPKIFRDLCIRRIQHKSKKKLQNKIYQTVVEYCRRNGNVDESSDFEGYGNSAAAGYETFHCESD